MFVGFTIRDVVIDGVRIHARVGGSGPPVLLLHGYPQTHVIWHEVAGAMAESHTVVVSDLRGYGDSSKPASEADHSSYGKRAMATDQVGLMKALGHERFAVVGHDRGARVAHRLCLDHRERVERAAIIDIVPTRHVFANVDRVLATFYYHWFFLAQEPDLPEVLIGAAPELFVRHTLDRGTGPGAVLDEEAVAEYVRCFRDPEAIRASCEDYRAGASVDLEHDEADAAAGRRVTCPLLVLWGARGLVGNHYDVLEVWRRYADDVRGHGLDCGHFVPEEAPEQTIDALRAFLAS